MNILMISNTFTPHVGGVAKSVQAFTNEYRRRGHRVLVVAPEFEGMPAQEQDVIRVPAIQNFNGSDFSVRLPIPGFVFPHLHEFKPEIVHTHHPFLLGDTALLISASFNIPLVFTHHTMYEQYTHYVPGDSPALQQFVVQLSTGYANLCDRVFAPSESVATILKGRGVTTPMEVVPTGVDLERFCRGTGSALRDEFNIPAEALVIGHTGRLAPEKNLEFLARAVSRFLTRRPPAHFLVIGRGPSEKEMRAVFQSAGVAGRVHFAGVLKGEDLVDAYHAMDVFAFSSKSETQGMVLTEAMAAGVPVVALDAPGVREVVRDKENGRLLPGEDIEDFVSSLEWTTSLTPEERHRVIQKVRETAEQFSMHNCAVKALKLYGSVLTHDLTPKDSEDSMWSSALRLIEGQWDLWVNRAQAAGSVLTESPLKKKPVHD